jgi:signal transduction histidine kinase/DNA-binding response OmpR family regulator
MLMGSLRLNFRAQLLLGFGAVLLVSAVVSAVAYRYSLGYRNASIWVRHSEQTIADAQAAHLTLEGLDNAYRKFLLTGSDASLSAFRRNVQAYHDQLEQLSQLTADNPAQAARWRAIEAWIDLLRTEHMEPGIDVRQKLASGAPPTNDVIAFDLNSDQQRRLDEIRGAFDEGVAIEQQLLNTRTATVANSSVFLMNVLVTGTVVTIALGVGVAFFVAHHLGAGMDRLAQGAHAVTAGDLDRRINLRRGDEIGEVADAFDRMAEALQQDRAEREAVERLKDEFVSVVSHELRTPLTSIRGSLGLLHAGLLGPISTKAERMLEVAVSNTDRLIRLINDVLDIERMRSGHMPMQMAPSVAHDLVQRSVESLKSLADAAHVTLVEQVEPLELVVDADRIVQTLTNLVSNAIKFSSTDASIEIAARRQDGEALFSVADHGRGIPPDKLETIFGRFEQVDRSDTRDKGGTGLGLAISRSIVQLHGGRIWVESEIGRGSTFYFTLPVSGSTAVTPAPALEAERGPRILIVDDDPSLVEVVSDVLAREGYRPIGALNGADALRAARQHPPAAILLDLAMPGMTGWEVLAALKADAITAEVPVVILSGLERVRDDRTEQTRGWIAKPVAPDALREMVDRVTARSDGTGRILIVEDDADLARVLRTSFEQGGLETDDAASSRRAIELSEARTPDVLLLDLALSEGDGFEVVEWYRQHDRLRTVPIVVYTARDLAASERDRLQLGHTEFVTKGRLSPEDVQRRVLRLVQHVVPANSGQQRAA